jgi:hypothetical protein
LRKLYKTKLQIKAGGWWGLTSPWEVDGEVGFICGIVWVKSVGSDGEVVV